jgi:hypothetical protein
MAAMLVETLDRIYFSQICKSAFLFKADTDQHHRLLDHGQFATMSLEIDGHEHLQ